METKIQGVKVNLTPNKKLDFDYGEGDIKALYNRGDWQNWKEEIRWLEQQGERDNELTPGEVVAMAEDLRSLDKARADFTKDPSRAFRMAHQHRSENNKAYAEAHRQAKEMARRSGK